MGLFCPGTGPQGEFSFKNEQLILEIVNFYFPFRAVKVRNLKILTITFPRSF